PRHRDPADGSELGRDDRRREGLSGSGALGRDLPGAGAHDHRAGRVLLRRRPARSVGPEAAPLRSTAIAVGPAPAAARGAPLTAPPNAATAARRARTTSASSGWWSWRERRSR